MEPYRGGEIRRYYSDVFGYDTTVAESSERFIRLFASFGVPMYYDARVSRPQVDAIPCDTALSPHEVYRLTESLLHSSDMSQCGRK